MNHYFFLKLRRIYLRYIKTLRCNSQVALVVKNLAASAGDVKDAVSVSGSRRSSDGVYGYPLQYSCLENPMDREVCWATAHKVAKSWTWLNWLSTHRWNWFFFFGGGVCYRSHTGQLKSNIFCNQDTYMFHSTILAFQKVSRKQCCCMRKKNIPVKTLKCVAY